MSNPSHATAWHRAFHYRDFRLNWIGEFISAWGTEMQYVALSWQIYLLTHSAFALGLIGLCRFIPVALFSLVGGATADGHNRKRILYITQSLLALCSLVLAYTTLAHTITPLVIYGITVLAGITLAFDYPARGAFVPNLVERKDLVNAMSIYEGIWYIARICGPALAGFLIASIGVGNIYLIDFLSTLVSIVTIFFIHNSGEVIGEKVAFSFHTIVEGFKFIKNTTVLWSTMALDFIAALFATATSLLPIFALDILHVGSQGLGFLYAASSVGALIAGFATARYAYKIHNHGKVFLLSILLYALAVVLFGLSRWYFVSLLLLVIAGAADSINTIIRITLNQLETPNAIRGRMESVSMLFWLGGPQLGGFTAGGIAALIGAPFALVIGGAVTLGITGVLAAKTPLLRNYQAKNS